VGLDITGLGSVFDLTGKVLDKIFPDKDAADKAKLALMQMQQDGQLKELDQEFQLTLEQIKVNAVEAASGSTFVSGGRPAAMWICNLGLLYSFILQPIFVWISSICHVSSPPSIDSGLLVQLLVGMLGLAGWRTVDKKNGVASK
jgi:hypothetical protein